MPNIQMTAEISQGVETVLTIEKIVEVHQLPFSSGERAIESQ